jgi:hypothetical protein
MKTSDKNILVAGLALVLFFFGATVSPAQTPIYVENFSFEEPGTEKQLNFENVPGWSTDTLVVDSGVETGWTPTDGDWTAFLKSYNTFIWQLTNHTIAEGDEIDLLVDARITWAALLLEISFFYDDNGVKVFTDVEEWELTEVMEEYGAHLSAAAFPQSIGKKMGIAFNNTTDLADTWIGLDYVRLFNDNPLLVETKTVKPTAFVLEQNYPNPFNPVTQIRYSLQASENVTIDIYDVFGHLINRLMQQNQVPGEHQLSWDGRDFKGQTVSSGIYICSMQAGESRQSIKMILQK